MLATKLRTVQQKTVTPGFEGLIAGDEQLGYFGEVTAASFITGADLASAFGYTEGVVEDDITTPWLKFAFGGKVLYVAKRPLRSNMNWNGLNTLGMVLGTATIVVGGKTYKVRLLTGTNTAGSEWNELMYRVSNEHSLTPQFASNALADLIGTTSGNGSASWIQNSAGALRFKRGSLTSITTIVSLAPGTAQVANGWRPCLEWVP